jgi:iron-sulfur cluster assembly accessory protein
MERWLVCDLSGEMGRFALPRRSGPDTLKVQEFGFIRFKGRLSMSTATVTPSPEVVTAAPKAQPVSLTPAAITKVKEIMATQDPVPAGLRIGVVGGGCSGFQYSMSFENQSGMMDKVYRFDDLKVFLDATSAMYLNNCVVDYVETLEAAGFKFENAAVKSTCGCGSSFSV